MRKIIGTLFLFGVCLGLTACDSDQIKMTTAEPSAAETETVTEEADEPIRVGFVFNGTVEENRAFYTGALNAAEEFGAELQVLCGDNEEVWEEQVLQGCENGSDYIVGAAPEIADYIAMYADEYPEITFAVLDAEVPGENVISVYVSQETAFFEAGVMAAGITKQTDIPAINEAGVIGWIGGMNIPIVQDYYSAFAMGAKSVDPEIQILEQYTGSWENPEEGRKLAVLQHEQGADIIVGLAGGSNEGVKMASEECGFYQITVANEMEQVGYFLVRNLLQEELEGGTVIELSAEDGCTVLEGLPAGTEKPEKEVTSESIATDANA